VNAQSVSINIIKKIIYGNTKVNKTISQDHGNQPSSFSVQHIKNIIIGFIFIFLLNSVIK